MSSVTIRKVPEELLQRVKAVAARNGRSMEHELRELLRRSYPSKAEVLASVQRRWERTPTVEPDEVDAWIETGRR